MHEFAHDVRVFTVPSLYLASTNSVCLFVTCSYYVLSCVQCFPVYCWVVLHSLRAKNKVHARTYYSIFLVYSRCNAEIIANFIALLMFHPLLSFKFHQ